MPHNVFLVNCKKELTFPRQTVEREMRPLEMCEAANNCNSLLPEMRWLGGLLTSNQEES
jgi:hypothetical protein